MAPTPEEYRAALDALRDDAKEWQHCSDDIGAASLTASGLDLDGRHFTWIGEAVGITRLYQSIQAKVTRLLGEGQDMSANVANSLLKSAQTYEDEENQGVHRFNNVW